MYIKYTLIIYIWLFMSKSRIEIHTFAPLKVYTVFVTGFVETKVRKLPYCPFCKAANFLLLPYLLKLLSPILPYFLTESHWSA